MKFILTPCRQAHVVAIGLALLLIFQTEASMAMCVTDKPLRNTDGSVVEAVTRWDGVEVRSGPSRASTKLRTLDFAASFRVFQRRNSYYCLGDAGGGFAIGWVSERDILISRTARVDPETKCFIKVMVRGNLDTIDTREAPFWSHPVDRGTVRRRAGLYEVRFVFDILKVPRRNNTEYVYLTGTGQRWNLDNADSILDGWVSENYVFIWNTRVGVQYNTNLKEPVFIYPNREDLEAAYCAGETRRWSFSSLGGVEWHFERERFPVLSEAQGNKCLKNRQVLEIGAFGTVLLNERQLSAAEADSIISTINRLRGGNQNIDILFVIDGTESMQPAFTEVERAVEKVKEEGALADARYALVVFKDSTTMWPPRMSDRLFSADAFPRQLDLYMRQAGADRGDTTLSEDVLGAVQYALDQMEERQLWRENSTRAMILVGDHGDHRDVDHLRRLEALLQTLDSQRVRFFAYQTRNTRKGEYSRDGRQFADQTYLWFKEDALEIMKGTSALFPRVEIGSSNANNIVTELREMRYWRKSIEQGYETIRRGGVPPSLAGPYIQRMLRESGLELNQVLGWGAAPQVCGKGFTVLQNDAGQDLFQKRIRISYENIGQLVVAFRNFVPDVNNVPRCLSAMTAAFQAATGDIPLDTESPAEFLQRTLGIKVKSHLLTLPFGNLAQVLVNNRAERNELRARLERSVSLLDAVYREEQVRERLDGSVDVVYGDDGWAKQQRWFKVLPDGTRVAWIPENYIP